MTFRGFRLPMVAAVRVVTLAAMLAGTYLCRRETEVGPLIRRSVDDRFVYVQVHDRDDGYLYELVPLSRAGGELA